MQSARCCWPLPGAELQPSCRVLHVCRPPFVEADIEWWTCTCLCLQVVGLQQKDHATLVGVHGEGSQLFMTDVVFRGDNIRSRAVDVNTQRQSYCRGA